MREATNVYHSPTFGLTKGPGFKFIKKLGNASSFTDAHWFSFKIDTDEFYIGAIVSQAVVTSGVSDGTVCHHYKWNWSIIPQCNCQKNNFVTTCRDNKLCILSNKTTTVTQSSTKYNGYSYRYGSRVLQTYLLVLLQILSIV